MPSIDATRRRVLWVSPDGRAQWRLFDSAQDAERFAARVPARTKTMPLGIRILRKRTIAPNGCWLWNGKPNRFGYGVLCIRRDGRQWTGMAHRLSYEALVGPIPDGLTLDHVCHTKDLTCPPGICVHRRCVNPTHLEPVTIAENRRRERKLVAS